MKTQTRRAACICAVMLTLTGSSALAQESASASPGEVTSPQDALTRVLLDTEFGFINVLQNDLQQGRNGTTIDLPEEAGQDIFFPFFRFSADVLFNQRHRVRFLYQPLDLKTRTVFRRDQVIDSLTFPEGTPVDVRYGFDFYRLSYDYDLIEDEDMELSVGGGFQIRLARLEFTSVDGSLGRIRNNIGPVPLIRARFRYELDNGWWFGSEVDGFYASFRIANGSTDAEVTGSIWDWSVRAGRELQPGLDAYLNLRYIGGGAEGDNPSDAGRFPGSDGYSNNFLQALTLSLGFTFEPAVVF